MTLTQFWQIIDTARGGECEAMAAAVAATLEQQNPEEIVAFAQHLSDRLTEAYRWDLWAVAYLINGGCSDDGFEYFRAWLVAQGRERFGAALANPEAAGDWATAYEAECEELLGAPSDAYRAKTGRDLPYDQVDSKQPTEPVGEEWDENSVESQYPQLAAKYA